MPASFGVHGPGEITIRSGLNFSISRNRNLIVPEYPYIRAKLSQVLDEVIGKRIIIIDH